MFVYERRKLIKNILDERKQIEVSSLSKIMQVSEVTIRRDLEILEKEGYLTRIYGGAYLLESSSEQTGTEPIQEEAASPTLIELGKIATHFIEDNSAIIIGPGKTNIYIAKQVKSKCNVKVITSDLNVIEELCNGLHSITPVIIGGDVNIYSKQVSGVIASMVLSNMNVPLSFVEVDGVSFEKGYYVDSYDKASIIQAIMASSKETIAVCGSEVFDNRSLFYLNELDSFKQVITTPDIPDKYKKYFLNKGIKLYTSYDIYQQP